MGFEPDAHYVSVICTCYREGYPYPNPCAYVGGINVIRNVCRVVSTYNVQRMKQKGIIPDLST